MGVIVRPDDLQSIMAEVYARLDAIERTSGPMHDFAIRDSNGVLRVAGGNLPALGISPAQEGIRVVDQYGNPIFDTLGLTSVMQQPSPAAQLAYPGLATPVAAPAAPAAVNVSSLSVTFTLARPTVVWAVGAIGGVCTGASIAAVGASFASGATDPASNSALYGASGTIVNNASLYLSKLLAAGSWTAYLVAYGPVGATTLNVYGGSLYVFQLGS